MRPLLLGVAAFALTASSIAFAQERTPTPEPNATPPANQSEPATPDMKATPVPLRTDKMGAADSTTKAPGVIPDPQWVGRYIYSSDNRELGKVAAVKTSGGLNEVDFDMGGFLGLGATRKHVTASQIDNVQADRIVLRLSKSEAEALPADK